MKIKCKGLAIKQQEFQQLGIYPKHGKWRALKGRQDYVGLKNSIWIGTLNIKQLSQLNKFDGKIVEVTIKIRKVI